MGYHDIIAQDLIALFCAQRHKCKKKTKKHTPLLLPLFALSFADLGNCCFLYGAVLDRSVTPATTNSMYFFLTAHQPKNKTERGE